MAAYTGWGINLHRVLHWMVTTVTNAATNSQHTIIAVEMSTTVNTARTENRKRFMKERDEKKRMLLITSATIAHVDCRSFDYCLYTHSVNQGRRAVHIYQTPYHCADKKPSCNSMSGGLNHEKKETRLKAAGQQRCPLVCRLISLLALSCISAGILVWRFQPAGVPTPSPSMEARNMQPHPAVIAIL